MLPAPRLFDDVEMLVTLFQSDTPASFPMRYTKCVEVFYSFFDASGSGLGSMLQGKDKNSMMLRIGVWSTQESKEESSNWREFSNTVKGIKEEAAKGTLRHALLFLCTDNSTVESAVSKGNTPSPKLFKLVMELKKCQMEHGFMVHVIHVSGARMIRQGTDGVSRGELGQALKLDKPIREFIPINISALDRTDRLRPWLDSWMGKDTIVLEPSQWYVEAHDIRFEKSAPPPRSLYYEHGTYLWASPPALGDVALEQLRYARIKRQRSTHIFLIPKLFAYLWWKQLYKCMDLIVIVPVGLSFWPLDMYEPLYLAFCFPFARFKPWISRGTPKLCYVERELQKVWKEKGMDGRDLLLKLRVELKDLSTLPEHVVRSLLFFE